MVEAENLENNWGEKKWNKFVEKSKKESVKAFIVVEALNSRLFETSDHMIFASIILETNEEGHVLNLVTLSISQNVNQNSNKFVFHSLTEMQIDTFRKATNIRAFFEKCIVAIISIMFQQMASHL